MKLRQPSSRWALWVFAAALLLKAGMPWLANASAQWQGKTLVEVCTVYGVAWVAQEGPATDLPAPAHPAVHVGTDCALTALAAFAPVDPAAIAALPAALHTPAHPGARSAAPPRDACARWAARRHHGPPALA